jgi:hypothetical protein
MELADILKDYGPWAVLCGFLIWQGWQREQRMAKRLDHVEDQIRDHLVRVIERNTHTMGQVLSALHERPCLMDEGAPRSPTPRPIPMAQAETDRIHKKTREG